MPSVDFAAVKQQVSIVDALARLNVGNLQVKGNSLRGPCPFCKDTNPRAFVVSPGVGLFHCFSCKESGDVISLAAKLLDVPLREAALWLVGDTAQTPTAPQEQQGRSQPAASGMKPLDYLEPEHEAVLVLGLNPALAKRLGIGYAPKGVAKGEVLVPVRDEAGVLHGYLGVQELSFIPKDFQLPDNVVPIAKKA